MYMERCCSSSSSGIAALAGGVKKEQQKQLPVGYRFRPTDEELLLHYLKRKIFSLPLPASDVIPDCDVFLTHPSLLPGDLMEKRYFFSSRRDVTSSRYWSCINANNGRRGVVVHVHVIGTSSSSTTSSGGGGYWKVNNGKDKVILASSQLHEEQAIGLRRSMVFYQGKPADPHAIKTPWIMHQFHLLATYYSAQECRTSVMEMGDWVVCRVFQKKNSKPEKISQGTFKRQKSTHHGEHSVRYGSTSSDVEMRPSVIDLIMEKDEGTYNIAIPPQDCSSSSEITAGVSCRNEVLDDQDREEACSTRAGGFGL